MVTGAAAALLVSAGLLVSVLPLVVLLLLQALANSDKATKPAAIAGFPGCINCSSLRYFLGVPLRDFGAPSTKLS